MTFTVLVYGYTTFLPGGWWETGTFFSYYTMVGVCPILFLGWKFLKKTKMIKAEEADLVWERPEIDAYEASCIDENKGFLREMAEGLGVLRRKEVVIE